MKQYEPPTIIEHIVIRRRVAPTSTASEQKQTPRTQAVLLAAADLLSGIERVTTPAEHPALRAVLRIIHGSAGLPATVNTLARKAEVSRSTIWRELQTLGVPRSISVLVVLRAGLLARVRRELVLGANLAEATHRVGVSFRQFSAASRLVERAVLAEQIGTGQST